MQAPFSEIDRRFAYVLLASKNNLIPRNLLPEAIRLCSLENSKSIGDLLIENCFIDQDACIAFDNYFAQLIDQAGDDPIQCVINCAYNTVEEFLIGFTPVGQVEIDACVSRFASRLDGSVNQTVNPAFTVKMSGEGTHKVDVSRADDEQEANLNVKNFPFLEPCEEPDVIGRLGSYKIMKLLGEGTFGSVFLAFDETLHRKVAIKVLKPSLTGTSPPRKRFLKEARAAAAISHENIVHVYNTGESPLPYLVMEYVDGETLKTRLDRIGPLDFPEVLEFSRQLAESLAQAHEAGIIHRDIKPGNILVRKSTVPNVKLSDFGLARVIDDAAESQSGKILGTPAYMSPEQADGQRLDGRSDLFSLGSVIYTMVSGRPPFRAPSVLATMKRIANDTPRPIKEIIPEIPDWFGEIVEKLMKKDPEERFQTARELADLLTKRQNEFRQGIVPISSRSETATDHQAFGKIDPETRSVERTFQLLSKRFQNNARLISASMICMLLGAWGASRFFSSVPMHEILVFATSSSSKVEPQSKTTKNAESSSEQKTELNDEDELNRNLAMKLLDAESSFLRIRLLNNTDTIEIKQSSDLPKDPFRITMIWLDRAKPRCLNDKTLAQIGQLKNLETFLIHGFQVYEDANNITDDGFKACFSEDVGKTLTALTLATEFPKVSLEGYKKINFAKNLRHLSIGLSKEREELVRELILPELNILQIGVLRVGSLDLVDERLPKLQFLEMNKPVFNTAEVESLSRLKFIEELIMSNTIADDILCEGIGKCKTIRKILTKDLSGLSNNGLKRLLGLPALHSFGIDTASPVKAKLTEDQIYFISEKKELQKLWLRGQSFKDATQRWVGKMQNLSVLDVSNSSFSGSRPFQSWKSLQKINELFISNSGLDDESLKDLSELRNLRYLELSGNPRLSPDAINKLKQAIPGCEIIADIK
jgi:serine/threonine protein kinase